MIQNIYYLWKNHVDHVSNILYERSVEFLYYSLILLTWILFEISHYKIIVIIFI